MLKLDGKSLASLRETKLKDELANLLKTKKRSPCLTIFQVGDNPASTVYVSKKVQACQRIGILPQLIKMPRSIEENDLIDKIVSFNRNPDVDGIIVQLPLPKNFDTFKILNHVSPEKDVDCLTSLNLGRLFAGRPFFFPCTPSACLLLVDLAYWVASTNKYIPDPPRKDLSGKTVVVVGRSTLVGKPVSLMLIDRNATVIVCHSRSACINSYLELADIVIFATGCPHFFSSKILKENCIVIDVGISKKEDGRLVGDLKIESRSYWLIRQSQEALDH